MMASGYPGRGRVEGPTPNLVWPRDVHPELVRWLWPGRIPLGAITILDGDPDVGKSLVSLDLAARVSTGRAMPDGTTADLDGPAGVVLLNAEDDPASTLRPRLEAAGADCNRIYLLKAIVESTERDGQRIERCRLPTLADVAAIRKTVLSVGAKLVIVDPVAAYMGRTNIKVDAKVRSALAAQAKMAQEFGVAVLAVRTLTKTPTRNLFCRGGGSIGLMGAARSGLLVAKDPQDPTGRRRCLASTKANLAVKLPTLVFRLVSTTGSRTFGAPRVEWLGAADTTAESLLATTVRDKDRTALAEAESILQAILSGGPVSAKEVVRQATEAGVAERTLRRAKVTLGVEAVKKGGPGEKGRWLWRLPTPGG